MEIRFIRFKLRSLNLVFSDFAVVASLVCLVRCTDKQSPQYTFSCLWRRSSRFPAGILSYLADASPGHGTEGQRWGR